jgi:5-methylcytosine-specific restriction endonuclease McrA
MARVNVESPKSRYKRRLREAKRRGTHTRREWAVICARFHWRCVRCFIPKVTLIGGVITKDHIVALRHGGSDAADNLQPLCRECQRYKEAEPIERQDYRHDFYDRLLDYLAEGGR